MAKRVGEMIRSFIVTLLLALTTPSLAGNAPKLPQQFLGEWCLDSSAPGTSDSSHFYKRGNRCEYDEDHLKITPTQMFAAVEAECKLIKIESTVRDKGVHAWYSCRHFKGDTWTSESWLSMPRPNRLAIRGERDTEKRP
jgi:hypothetical protein